MTSYIVIVTWDWWCPAFPMFGFQVLAAQKGVHMEAFKKLIISWVGLICLGMIIATLMLNGISAWWIILLLAGTGAGTYFFLFKGLGYVLWGIAAIVALFKILGLIFGGLGWLFSHIGIFKYVIVVIGFAIFVRWLSRLSHR